MRLATPPFPARRLRRLVAGFALATAVSAPAAAAQPRDLSYPPGFATYPLTAVRSPGVPIHELWFSTRVDNPPSEPTFAWKVDAPPGYPACNTFAHAESQVFRISGTTTYANEIHLQIGTAAGCPPDGSEGGSGSFEGQIAVTIVMGAITCTVGTTGPLNGQCDATGAGSQQPKPTAAKPAGGSSSKETDALLRQAGRKALTFELRQLPVLLHKPWLRQAIFTHFTSQTRAAIDRKLKQKKIAQAEQAKTHARLQRELRQGWKKVWDVRAELESYKDLCNRYVDSYDTVGKFEALVSAGLASIPGGALFLPLTMGMGGAARITQAEWARNAADPPDKHYKALVQPATPSFPAIATSGAPPALVAAATAFLADDAKAVGLVTAFRRSFERAQGAAGAGNGAWTERQLDAAAGFAGATATALGTLRADLTALEQQLSAAGDPLASGQSTAVAKLGAAAAPDRLLPVVAATTTKTAAALRALGTRLKALAAA